MMMHFIMFWDSSIEYVLNTVEKVLAYKMYKVKTGAELQTNIDIIIHNIPSFENYFTNVGYIHN